MRIEKIIIKNYRKFQGAETLELENDLSVIAGPNNCGKTSLINLLKIILCGYKDEKCKYSINDIPVKYLNEMINKIYEILSKIINTDRDTTNFYTELGKKLYEEFYSTELYKCTAVDFVISYEDETDTKKGAFKNFSDFIMDLDEKNKHFYFEYQFKLKLDIFVENLSSQYNNLKDKISNKQDIVDIILKEYNKSIEENVFYCNKDFDESKFNKIDRLSQFRNLFNVKIINASRPLDDQPNDKNHGLSQEIMTLVKSSNEWNDKIKELIEKLGDIINKVEIKGYIEDQSKVQLEKLFRFINETNGNEKTHLALDIVPNDYEINNFLENIIIPLYKYDMVSLTEDSQGLGYSNMIYMHLQIINFINNKELLEGENSLLYLFIIEEPESHMHPQMQQIFVDFLLEQYKKLNIQGIITTHSDIIVRKLKMKRLKVLKKDSLFTSKILNMKDIVKKIVNDQNNSDQDNSNKDDSDQDNSVETVENFFTFFFNVGYSEIIFADKVILYEGDTERLLINQIIQTNTKYDKLKKEYISYIQVGGAYAHIFDNLLKFLDIKSLIITDVDYNKDQIKEEEIFKENCGNGCIKYYYKLVNKKNEVTMKDIYSWDGLDKNGKIKIAFQNKNDNYARTLEEAMLCRLLNMKLDTKNNKQYWEGVKKDKKLQFAIPRNEDISIRDIVKSLSGQKNDFMYSIVLNNYIEQAIPNYIEEGLEWLMQ